MGKGGAKGRGQGEGPRGGAKERGSGVQGKGLAGEGFRGRATEGCSSKTAYGVICSVDPIPTADNWVTLMDEYSV